MNVLTFGIDFRPGMHPKVGNLSHRGWLHTASVFRCWYYPTENKDAKGFADDSPNLRILLESLEWEIVLEETPTIREYRLRAAESLLLTVDEGTRAANVMEQGMDRIGANQQHWRGVWPGAQYLGGPTIRISLSISIVCTPNFFVVILNCFLDSVCLELGAGTGIVGLAR
ncbi:hypothetical protein OSTOST_04970 [Ostertagia ostertagi]